MGMRTLDHMINEQVAMWLAAQERDGSENEYRPVITISRSYGARGAELAEEISRRTGFRVWDRDLVRAIAESARGDERIMESLDENRRTQLEETLRGLVVGYESNNLVYFNRLMRIVRTVAQHGSALVVGRGAHCAIKRERALRVRVDAPESWRVNRIAEKNGISLKAAEERVRQKDLERTDFVRYHFRSEVADPNEYDLTLNASTFGIEEMADLVLEAYAKRFKPLPLVREAVVA